MPKEQTRLHRRLVDKGGKNHKSARAGALRAVGRAAMLKDLLPDDEEEKQRKKAGKA